MQKSWSELEQEWCVHGRELAVARTRCRVDRDPERVLVAVSGGAAAASDLVRPRWRSLAERIENARLDRQGRLALRVLVEVALRGRKLLLAEARFGADRYPFVDGLIQLARCHRRFLRRPQDWRAKTHNARRQFASLTRHLVARYPVPAFLDAAWLRADAGDYRDWFVRLGAGENLRAAKSPIELTNRILHHFLRAPEGCPIELALRRGQILAFGGDEALVRAVAATRLSDRFDEEAFWVTVLRFFVRHPTLDRAQVGPIVDYLQSQRFERRQAFVARGVRRWHEPPQPNLSMKGRTPRALLREVERWHTELGRCTTGVSWPASGIGELEYEVGKRGRDLRVWRIRELLSAAELQEEGRAMRHCVVSYAGTCRVGGAAIFTMELHGFDGVQKRQTIEVRGQQRIVQCRGKCNRLPGDAEKQILLRWARQEGLSIEPYVLEA